MDIFANLRNVGVSLLSEATRKSLHEMGLARIRQSQYASGRRCPYLLKLSTKDAERMTVKALFGSVFHMAFGHPGLDSGHNDPQFYIELFRDVRAVDPNVKYLIPGPDKMSSVATWDDIRAFSRMFASNDQLTMTLGQLVMRLQEQIRMSGHSIVAQELHLRYLDGKYSKFPVELHGTADLITYFNGKYVLWDIKTSGLWDVYLENSTSGIKASSYSTPEITYHPQLRHYDWLLRKQQPQHSPTAYGILAPTNLVPYFKGDKQGQVRGSAFFLAASLGDTGAASYEQDMVDYLTSFARKGGQYRAYPSTYGKTDCPSCAFFNACQGDLTGSRQAATLSEDRFAYLRD